MNGQCAFCWSRHVRRAVPLAAGRMAPGSRLLMECRDCEKWFWADTGEEVPRLFEICATSLVNPRRCLEEIRQVLNSGGSGFPRRRAAEFNRLCSDCLNARFLTGSVALPG
jgi:hypothetical protein